MEGQHDPLSNHDLRQLWTRFEGLVGHQLYRLRVDGRPGLPPNGPGLSPTSKAASSGALPAGCCYSSSMCSLLSSEVSSLTTATSPARLMVEEHFVTRKIGADETFKGVVKEDEDCGYEGDDGGDGVSDAEGGGGGGGGGKKPTVGNDPSCNDSRPKGEDRGENKGGIIGTAIPNGEIVVGIVRSSCVDGEQDADDDAGDGVGGRGGGSVLGTSASCCALPCEAGAEGSTTSSQTSDVGARQQQVMRRNASSNALNTPEKSESQPLFGLPYVARAAGPLLSLLMVTLEEWAGQGGPQADTLLRLEEKRRECKRNMIGVYKQSLLLESQLHQYLNPGLVTSLNRRVARATFEAETMVNLVDKLRKESKKSAEDPERRRNVVEVSMKLKSLLGRQKCEWQCVGRLKETLTMAREMKDLLQFIARLSNTLERSKTVLGGLQDKPPPYEYCSPYADIPKTTRNGADTQRMIGSSDNHSNSSRVVMANTVSPGEPGDPDLGNYKPSIFLESRESDLGPESGDSVARGRQQELPELAWPGSGIKARVTPRGRSESPRKLSRSPRPQRSRSTDFDLESCSSFRDSNKKSKSSGRDMASVNSNESKSVVFDLVSREEDRGDRPHWLASPIKGERESPRNLMCLSKRRRHPEQQDLRKKKRISKQLAQECTEQVQCNRRSPEPPYEADGGGGGRRSCKTVTSGSPPRARPKEDCRRGGEGERRAREECRQRLKCSGNTCVIERQCDDSSSSPRAGSSPIRWDRSPYKRRSRLSDIEGSGMVSSSGARDSSYLSSGDGASSDLDSDLDISANSQSSPRQRASPTGKKAKFGKKDKGKNFKGAKAKGKSAKGAGSDGRGSPRSKGSSSPRGRQASSPRGKGSPSPTRGGSAKGSSPKRSRGGGYGSGGGTPDDSMEDPLLSCGDSSEGQDKSNSILIDIESEYPNKDVKSSTSCPPACCGRRRIRVTVNKRSSSTSQAKRREKSGSSRSAAPGRSASPRKTIEEGDAEKATSDEAGSLGEEAAEGDDARVVPGASDEENSNRSAYEDTLRKGSYTSSPARTPCVEEVKKVSSGGPGDTSNYAIPVSSSSPKPGSSPRNSNLRMQSSPMRNSSPSTRETGQASAESVRSGASAPDDRASRGSDLRSSIRSLAGAYEIPIIGRLDEPWKLGVLGLLLLLLLYWLLSMLRSCCGCGYLPNPFFFLTNSLAGRVTLRHYGPAPS